MNQKLCPKSGKHARRILCPVLAAILLVTACSWRPHWESAPPDTVRPWQKYEHNPVLAGKLGSCLDVAVLKEGDGYRMWCSWRPKKSIALVESKDGIHWSDPVAVLGPAPSSNWEDEVNRPVVIKHDGEYRMWYTGEVRGHSSIGYATSRDGRTWTRASAAPVLVAYETWEKVAVMCPDVLWDDNLKLYRMWYTAGDQDDPDGIGYATSIDGVHWAKYAANPIFRADPRQGWEQMKVTACQVVPHGNEFYMFYVGHHDREHAEIGLAGSSDGVVYWERLPSNPIIRPSRGQWDADACYKPFAILDGNRWLLWYNGRRGDVEQIGLAIHDGEDLGFRRLVK